MSDRVENMNPFEDFENELDRKVADSANEYERSVEDGIEREQRWKRNRIGKITSSKLPKIIPEKKDGKIKLAAGVDYLLEIKHQRDTLCDSEEVYAKAMNWGKEHEHEAHLYFKKHFCPDMLSGTFDFDDIVFVDGIIPGFGDSPDGCTEDHSYIAEYKCPYSGSEHLRNLALENYGKDEDYYWQLIGHFIDPRVRGVYFVSYDPRYPDEHPDKMKVILLNRSDVLADIETAKVKIAIFNEAIDSGDIKRIINL